MKKVPFFLLVVGLVLSVGFVFAAPKKNVQAKRSSHVSAKSVLGPASVRSLNDVQREKLKDLFPKPNVPNVWVSGAPNPVPSIRYGHAQCEDAPESFYVISGVDAGFGLTGAVNRYDAGTNSWTPLAPIPSPSEAPTSVCFEGKIYTAVGAGTSQEFLIYDIATDTWSSGATLPRLVEGAAMGALAGKVYLMGGDDDFQPANGVSNQVDIYDIATNTWTGTGAAMPAATAQAGYVQLGSFVYVVGGWGLAAPGANETTTQRYDMSTDTWEVGPSFTVAVADFAIAGTNAALYAMGGDQNGGGFFEPTTTAQRLDLSTWPSGTWTDLGDPLPSIRQANQAGFCTTAISGGEVWTTDAFNGGSVSGINDYKNTGEGCGFAPPCVYSNDFNDATQEWIEEKPTVTQPGDGFLHLTPLKKKAIATADASFTPASVGTYTFDVQFSGGTDPKNWLYISRVDKKNTLEILAKVATGKLIVKDRNGSVLAKAKADFAWAMSTPYQIVVNYDGTNVDVTVNGTPVITDFVPSRSLPAGTMGAAAKDNTLLLDNVCFN
jgi:hypothetical protein